MADRRPHGMQAGRAKPHVELVIWEFNLIEAVREFRLADEFVNRAHGARRIAHQRLISQQHQAITVRPIERLAQSIEGVADKPGARPYHFVAGVNSGRGFEVEDFRCLEGVALNQPLHAVEDPWRVPNATNRARFGEQFFQRSQLSGPETIGVEHDLAWMLLLVIIVEQPAQHGAAFRVVDKYRRLVVLTPRPPNDTEPAARRDDDTRMTSR